MIDMVVKCDCCNKDITTKDFYKIDMSKYSKSEDRKSIEKTNTLSNAHNIDVCITCAYKLYSFFKDMRSANKDKEETFIPKTDDMPEDIEDKKSSTNLSSAERKMIIKKEIYELYKSGMQRQDIANKYNINIQTVTNYIKELADPSEIRWTRRRKVGEPIDLSKIDIDEGKIMALYKAKWQIKDIAGDMSLTEDIVSSVIKKKSQGGIL